MKQCQVFSYLGEQKKDVMGFLPIPFYNLSPLNTFCSPSPPSFESNYQDRNQKKRFFKSVRIPSYPPSGKPPLNNGSYLGFYKVVDGLKNNFVGFLPFQSSYNTFFVFQDFNMSPHPHQQLLTIVKNNTKITPKVLCLGG